MLRICSEFIVQYGEWVVVLGLVFIFGGFGLYQYRGLLKRRQLVGQRRAVTEDEWFAEFYPAPLAARACVRQVLTALAEEIGVGWTQLRPTDTFEDKLRIPPRYSPIDDLDGADSEIASILSRCGIAANMRAGYAGSLSDFLDRLVLLRTQQMASAT
jgi:hypothetical protein